MTSQWPINILRPRSVSFEPMPLTQSGGQSISGYEQVVVSGAGLWRASFNAVAIRTAAAVKLWRAVSALLEGRAGVILVPLCDPGRKLGTGALDPVAHGDGAFFSDGSGYSTPGVSARISIAADLRATVVELTFASAHVPEPGQHFSIGERLYRIAQILSVAGSVYSVKIWPPLREAVADEAGVNFDDPVCRMRLASDDAMHLELDLNKFASPSPSFIEAL